MKDRLDIILTERGFFSSREKAKASIMAGLIYVEGQRIDKPGTSVDKKADITVKEDLCPYVSRGGLKLEKSLDIFGFSLKDEMCIRDRSYIFRTICYFSYNRIASKYIDRIRRFILSWDTVPTSVFVSAGKLVFKYCVCEYYLHFNSIFWRYRKGDKCYTCLLYTSRRDGGWIMGGAWDNFRWPKGKLPTKESLDKYFKNTPVFLLNKECHGAWVNSCLLYTSSNLFIIILALSFIEILLPDTSMGKYIKFIFSLVIMATILYPIIYLLGE